MSDLPGYDAWLERPYTDAERSDRCMECGDLFEPDDEPIKLDDGYACSAKCEALWQLKNEARTVPEKLEAARKVYGEEADVLLAIVFKDGEAILVNYLTHAGRSKPRGEYHVETFEGAEKVIHAYRVEAIGVTA